MESLQAFIQMGGHALYVWLVFGTGAVALAFNLYNLRRAQPRALAAAARDALVLEEQS